jgi:alpha-methylacyl-CoA racemase
MSVGALEPQFYAALIDGLGLADSAPDRADLTQWPALREALTARFREKTQAEWAEIFADTDACCAPVLPLSEAARHPHLEARGTYVDRDGLVQPAPAPRFSRTGPTLGAGPSVPGGQTREALTAWGVDGVEALIESGAAVQA